MADPSAGFDPPAGALRGLYEDLHAIHGAQPWWPAESPFEVMVGAVLTQNTAWSNVEKAMVRLKDAGLLSLPALLAVGHDALAETIRPSGYFNIKARRLRSLCEFLAAQGGVEAFARQGPAGQRAALLQVHGIGPETADDILLYALGRPVFVIDAYTRRLLVRHRLARGDEGYEALRRGFERALGPDPRLFQQYHALIVMHAKALCRKTPLCGQCGLAACCPTATGR